MKVWNKKVESEDARRLVKKLSANNVLPNFEELVPIGIEPKYTGLPIFIYVYTIGVEGDKLFPILKAQNNYSTKMKLNDCTKITIANNPTMMDDDLENITESDVMKIFNWIKQNKNVLIDLWYIQNKVNAQNFKSKLIKI
jgi:hypothetical protein